MIIIIALFSTKNNREQCCAADEEDGPVTHTLYLPCRISIKCRYASKKKNLVWTADWIVELARRQ